jgi:hypothetical protein
LKYFCIFYVLVSTRTFAKFHFFLPFFSIIMAQAQQEQQVEDQVQQQEFAEDLGTIAPNLIAVLETDGIKAGVRLF